MNTAGHMTLDITPPEPIFKARLLDHEEEDDDTKRYVHLFSESSRRDGSNAVIMSAPPRSSAVEKSTSENQFGVFDMSRHLLVVLPCMLTRVPTHSLPPLL
ncbi:unnamed protein product [Ectocarpus sp. 12 AP-2014]